ESQHQLAALRGRQQHQRQYAFTINRSLAITQFYAAGKSRGCSNKFCGGTRMQPCAIGHGDGGIYHKSVFIPAGSSQLLMANLGIIATGIKMLLEFLAKVNLAVLSPGAADRDGDIAAIIGPETRKPALEIIAD